MQCPRFFCYSRGSKSFCYFSSTIQISASVCIFAICQLMSKCIQNRILHGRRFHMGVIIRNNADMASRVSLFNLYITAQYLRRRTAIMTVYHGSISGIPVNSRKWTIFCLINNTCIAFIRSSNQLCHIRLSITPFIFIIFHIPGILYRICPLRSILKPEIHCPAVIYNTIQI